MEHGLDLFSLSQFLVSRFLVPSLQTGNVIFLVPSLQTGNVILEVLPPIKNNKKRIMIV